MVSQGNIIKQGTTIDLKWMEWNQNGWRAIKNPSTHSKEGNWVIINKEQLSIIY